MPDKVQMLCSFKQVTNEPYRQMKLTDYYQTLAEDLEDCRNPQELLSTFMKLKQGSLMVKQYIRMKFTAWRDTGINIRDTEAWLQFLRQAVEDMESPEVVDKLYEDLAADRITDIEKFIQLADIYTVAFKAKAASRKLKGSGLAQS